MRANSIEEWTRMLDRDDFMYGFSSLSPADRDKLTSHLEWNAWDLMDPYRELFRSPETTWEMKVKAMEAYYTETVHKNKYMQDVFDTRVLEYPAGVSDPFLRLDQLNALMQPSAPVADAHIAYGRGNEAFSNSIRLLQKHLDVPEDGLYRLETAEALYNKVRPVLPGREYVSTGRMPDFLFDIFHKPYIMYIDDRIWHLAGMDLDYFRPDNSKIWEEGAFAIGGHSADEFFQSNPSIWEKGQYLLDSFTDISLRNLLKGNKILVLSVSVAVATNIRFVPNAALIIDQWGNIALTYGIIFGVGTPTASASAGFGVINGYDIYAYQNGTNITWGGSFPLPEAFIGMGVDISTGSNLGTTISTSIGSESLSVELHVDLNFFDQLTNFLDLTGTKEAESILHFVNVVCHYLMIRNHML
ncbi:hypothetical protein LJC32_06130 [Oscillospiraceae bacterium OttesenSCG-928-F05]|nr:hypothetical protein [Oscillospiraceae bacterium OttesenSCG-928-F05]